MGVSVGGAVGVTVGEAVALDCAAGVGDAAGKVAVAVKVGVTDARDAKIGLFSPPMKRSPRNTAIIKTNPTPTATNAQPSLNQVWE